VLGVPAGQAALHDVHRPQRVLVLRRGAAQHALAGVRARLALAGLACRVLGHAEKRWYTGRGKASGQPEQVLACPRCHAMFDVRRGGPRRVRREAARRDWRRAE
jgi:hypothetical protein